MPFGFSFGKSKQKIDQTTDVNKVETGTQVGQSTTASSGTTTETGTTSQTGSSTGTSTTSQTGTQQQTGTQTGQTQQTTSLFRDGVVNELEGAVRNLLTSTQSAPTTISDFDPDAFISGGLAQAQALQGANLEDSINQLINQVGGTPGSNSAVALLANRARGDAAANLAGIRSQLTGQAEQIQRENLMAGSAIDQTQQQFLGALLQQLKGGVATTTGQETQATTQTGTTATTGTTQTAEQTQQQQEMQSQQTQQLIQILDQLLASTSSTVGTEHMVGTQKKSGGGFSFATG